MPSDQDKGYGRTDDEMIEGLPASLKAAEQMPANLALVKMENDQIFAIARAHPRDYAAITAKLFAMVKAYPESAEEAIYVKPVGSVLRVQCSCGKVYESPYAKKKGENQSVTECRSCGKTNGRWTVISKYARNLSIRAAESIRQAFGFNRVATSVDAGPNGTYKITASFVDYAEGNVTQDERLVSQYITGRSGTWKIDDDRFFGVTLEAEKAKARRNAIMGGINSEVKSAYYDFCEKTTRELLTPEKMQAIVSAFASKGVTLEQIEQKLGQKASDGWTVSHREELAQIWTAIKSGEANVAEFFGTPMEGDGDAPEPIKTPSGNAGASASDFTKPKAQAATKPKSEGATAPAPAGSSTEPGDVGAPSDSKEKAPRKPRATKPKPYTMAEYQADLAKATTAAEANAAYDKAAGPESTWPEDELRLSTVLRADRIAEINKPADDPERGDAYDGPGEGEEEPAPLGNPAPKQNQGFMGS